MSLKKLKNLMNENEISEVQLSQMTGISCDELNKKLGGETEFTLWEIKCISEIFSLKGWQIMHIFFDKKFPKGNDS